MVVLFAGRLWKGPITDPDLGKEKLDHEYCELVP